MEMINKKHKMVSKYKTKKIKLNFKGTSSLKNGQNGAHGSHATDGTSGTHALDGSDAQNIVAFIQGTPEDLNVFINNEKYTFNILSNQFLKFDSKILF